MTTLNTFDEDLSVARSILNRDGKTTREFLYRKCYPLFKSIYNNYYTDSSNVCEFINEIYLLILTPSKTTGRCQLENYRGESSLATWIKTVCLFYCYHRFVRKQSIPKTELVNDEKSDCGDRIFDKSYSITMYMDSINRGDLESILGMMPNERYQEIIRLRYIEQKTNEETAEALGMSMANFYNKHKLAKEQFVCALKKEARNG